MSLERGVTLSIQFIRINFVSLIFDNTISGYLIFEVYVAKITVYNDKRGVSRKLLTCWQSPVRAWQNWIIQFPTFDNLPYLRKIYLLYVFHKLVNAGLKPRIDVFSLSLSDFIRDIRKNVSVFEQLSLGRFSLYRKYKNEITSIIICVTANLLLEWNTEPCIQTYINGL